MVFQEFFNFKTFALLSLLVGINGVNSAQNTSEAYSNKATLIGQPCTSTIECPANANCNNGNICLCPYEYIHSGSLDRCLEREVSFGRACEESQQCQKGSKREPYVTCINGRCGCTGDAIGVSDRVVTSCLKKADYVGDTCEGNEQCVVNLGASFCVDSKCTCFPGYIPSNNSTRCVLEAE